MTLFAIEGGHAAALGAADVLCFTAAPTFALMALLTRWFDSGPTLCLAAHGPTVLSGMVPMYLLMSGFHLAPWLKLAARRFIPAKVQNSGQ